jgi:hypothetical protein
VRRSFAMLKSTDISKLVKVIAETRETEIGCDECFERLDIFVEAELSGFQSGTAMPLVSDHLDKCEDCRSEFKALLAGLRST